MRVGREGEGEGEGEREGERRVRRGGRGRERREKRGSDGGGRRGGQRGRGGRGRDYMYSQYSLPSEKVHTFPSAHQQSSQTLHNQQWQCF